jgi:hypothetical protein
MAACTNEETHFVLGSGPGSGPVFLAAQDFDGQPQLVARPHIARTFSSALEASVALPPLKATPVGAGGSWRVMTLQIVTTVRDA